jgi:hypothetical protein
MAEEKKVLTSEEKRTLIDTYESFLRVGKVTSEEFFTLEIEERACLLAAQKRIDLERALVQAEAFVAAITGDPIRTADLITPVDGGKTKVRLVIEKAIARYTEKVEKVTA